MLTLIVHGSCFKLQDISSVQFSSVLQLCLSLCHPWTATRQASLSITNSPSLLTHVHWAGDAIQPSHPLSSPSPPALNLSQHQGLFKWVSSSHQVANRFNGLDLIDRVPDELWMEVCDIVQEIGIKTIPKKKKCKKSKMAVWGGLTNSCEKNGSEKQRRKGKI